jgi:hypothetical protein
MYRLLSQPATVFCPQYTPDFVWFSEQLAIISLNSINELIFVIETFFDVTVVFLHII